VAITSYFFTNRVANKSFSTSNPTSTNFNVHAKILATKIPTIHNKADFQHALSSVIPNEIDLIVNNELDLFHLQPTHSVDADAVQLFIEEFAPSLKFSDVVLSEMDANSTYYFVYDLMKQMAQFSPTHLHVVATRDIMNKYAHLTKREDPCSKFNHLVSNLHESEWSKESATVDKTKQQHSTPVYTIATESIDLPALEVAHKMGILTINRHHHGKVPLLCEVHNPHHQGGSMLNAESTRYQFITQLLVLLLHNQALHLPDIDRATLTPNSDSVTGILTDGDEYHVVRVNAEHMAVDAMLNRITSKNAIYTVEYAPPIILLNDHMLPDPVAVGTLLSHVCSALNLSSTGVISTDIVRGVFEGTSFGQIHFRPPLSSFANPERENGVRRYDTLFANQNASTIDELAVKRIEEQVIGPHTMVHHTAQERHKITRDESGLQPAPPVTDEDKDVQQGRGPLRVFGARTVNDMENEVRCGVADQDSPSAVGMFLRGTFSQAPVMTRDGRVVGNNNPQHSTVGDVKIAQSDRLNGACTPLRALHTTSNTPNEVNEEEEEEEEECDLDDTVLPHTIQENTVGVSTTSDTNNNHNTKTIPDTPNTDMNPCCAVQKQVLIDMQNELNATLNTLHQKEDEGEVPFTPYSALNAHNRVSNNNTISNTTNNNNTNTTQSHSNSDLDRVRYLLYSDLVLKGHNEDYILKAMHISKGELEELKRGDKKRGGDEGVYTVE
jgi:hypothetical protein